MTPRTDRNAIFSAATLEKVLLLAMIAVIFSQVLTGIRATTLQLVIGVTAVVVMNAVISLWGVEHGSRYGSTVIQFAAMATVNLGIVTAGVVLRHVAGISAYMPVQAALFYLLLLSLVITMYDRYRIIGNLSSDKRPPLRQRMRVMPRRTPAAAAAPVGAAGA